MKILVANLGSTSFKYRLFDLGDPGEPMLARGAVDRIGGPSSKVVYASSKGKTEADRAVPDHGEAVRLCLEQLTNPATGVIGSASEVSAIGFKAVHAKGISGVQRVDARLLSAMEAFNDVTPAHNPPYVRAMRMLAERFPEMPLVAAFETGFHATIPDRNRRYAVPNEWATEHGVLRWGFHGASHRFIAERTALLLNRPDLRLISCHLGGSSSLCAIRDGKSVATSMGMSPQSGLLQNNRVGDFDPFALPAVMRATGMRFEEALAILANRSGLLGICGKNDLRDVEAAAETGEADAQLALDMYVSSIRHYLGAYLVELGDTDAIVFTAGIGENSPRIRSMVCRDLERLGILLNDELNEAGHGERKISAADSKVEVWVMPTNEEIIVARQARDLLSARS
ncbi:acetate/propionate family kinase [Tautonia plasticadhaerens]|uniref:Acetate kinase n=1 Tax=Tautonia plasticadhaerens TaxID=2527974 RepID=A0A518H789_9BACT|nr:acetate/propionate family kinase [Tautonia plasticadhaerens]QDV36651.1 Acetate kinase [Tautonia plasticadhaerens]